MRIDLNPNGSVDDLVVDAASPEILRLGESRYVLRTHGPDRITVTFWTTRKDRILVQPWEDRPPWVALELGSGGELVSFRAVDCDLHFEQLDRNAYFFGVSRADGHWGLTLRAHGYIIARVEATEPTPSEREQVGRIRNVRMIVSKEPNDSITRAEAILTAVERADLDERNFGLDDLCSELPSLVDEFGTERLKTILVATGCTCANELVATWVRVCPDDTAPLLALEATRAWLAEPTGERAACAASLSQAALDSFARNRGTGRQPSWPAHAWFARTCAWLADAPQHGWQSVAALLGLIKAGMRGRLATELETQLRHAAHGKG